ncbi:MAG: hypothetical protein PUC14_01920 [Bacteroidales bacterium]|nr:hypothetical protein [Bacteroidales bacterium]
MDGIFKFIMKIISIILIIIAFLILLSSLYKIGTFEDIKNLFSRDKETEEVTEIAEEIEIIEEIPDDDTHLIFNNVPINGTLKSYIAQMEKKGFKINGWANLTKEEEQEIKSKAYKDGKAEMIGDFADFKRCRLYVETLTNKDLVYKIRVEFEYTSEWKELKENYSHLKQLLTKKYGTPASCTERIKYEYSFDTRPSFDPGYSTFNTLFKTDKGDITLFINSNYKLTLEYLDKKNSKLITDHALDEL